VAGNTARYSTAQLKAKHFGTSLAVKALDIQSPSATVPASLPHTAKLTVTFSEPTLWQGSSPTPFTVNDDSTFTSVSGTWACKDAAGAATSCASQNGVKSATFSGTFTAGHKYDVSTFGGIFDTSGNGPLFLFSTVKVT
jgi:hypothetical protein